MYNSINNLVFVLNVITRRYEHKESGGGLVKMSSFTSAFMFLSYHQPLFRRAVTLDHKTVHHFLVLQDNSLLVLSKDTFSLRLYLTAWRKTFVVNLADSDGLTVVAEMCRSDINVNDIWDAACLSQLGHFVQIQEWRASLVKNEYVYPETLDFTRNRGISILFQKAQSQLLQVSQSPHFFLCAISSFVWSVCIESILARFYPLLTFFSKTPCAFVDIPVNEEAAYL